jgi:hypothetical protein
VSTRREANAEAVARVVGARPAWVGVKPAAQVVPALRDGLLLHAGPPLRVAPPRVVARALAGALVLEGRVESLEAGIGVVADGSLELSPGNDHAMAAPLAGVVSASMPVVVIRDEETGAEAYSPLSEGGGRVLRFGCLDPETLVGLRRLGERLGPLFDRLLAESGPIPLYGPIGTALHMGDDCHHRFQALKRLLALELLERCDACGWPSAERQEIVGAVTGNDYFPLNLVAAASKAAALAAEGVDGSSLVTAIARNGVETGVRLSGLPGEWFTAPVGPVEAVEVAAAAAAEADRDTGDSCIIEVNGLGACALACAPALSRWFGGSYEAMSALASSMYELTLAEHPGFTIPALDYRGTPVGIDAERAVTAGVGPITETILVSPELTPPIAAVGHSRVPLDCLKRAVEALPST